MNNVNLISKSISGVTYDTINGEVSIDVDTNEVTFNTPYRKGFGRWLEATPIGEYPIQIVLESGGKVFKTIDDAKISAEGKTGNGYQLSICSCT